MLEHQTKVFAPPQDESRQEMALILHSSNRLLGSSGRQGLLVHGVEGDAFGACSSLARWHSNISHLAILCVARTENCRQQQFAE